MQALVVVKVQVATDMCDGLDQAPESVEVHHRCLHHVIKQFHIRVVPAAVLATLAVRQVIGFQHCIQLFIRNSLPRSVWKMAPSMG